MDTTHPENPAYSIERAEWRKQILQFSKETTFEGLKIDAFIDGEKTATVTFTALLQQGRKDATFTEKSQFVKVNGRWLYQGPVFFQR